MTKEEAQKYISTQHIYANVTLQEVAEYSFHKFVTEVEGIRLLGTDTPYDAIESKELV